MRWLGAKHPGIADRGFPCFRNIAVQPFVAADGPPTLCRYAGRRGLQNNTFTLVSRYVAHRSILQTMKIATGKVVGGKVVIDGASLEEGASVTVLARDSENGFTLSSEEEAELLLSIAEADRGETISAEEVLAKLARRRA
jgi:hypothetical protein